MTRRTLLAVLRARLYAQRRIVVYSCAAAFVAGLLQPAGLAAPLFLCSLLGIAMALAQSPGLDPHLDWCEQSAPLFGREIARAKALVPCVAGYAGCAHLCFGAASARRPRLAANVSYRIRRSRCRDPDRTIGYDASRRAASALRRARRRDERRGLHARRRYTLRSRRTRILLDRCILGLAPIRRNAGALRSDLSGRRGCELFQHRAVELREIVAAARRDQIGIGYRRLIPIQAAGVADVVGD